MKAVVYRQYGRPGVMQVENQAKPKPKDNQFLIKVEAVEATKSDCELRSFHFPVNWFWLPLRIAWGFRKPKRQVLGSYFAGVIVEAGANASRFQVGDEVFGTSGFHFGAYAEYVVVPETVALVKKPKNISFAEAAAVPLGGLNALHFMNLANIQAGEKVLINGAGGSIGCYAIQIAKQRGAEVTGVDATHKKDLVLDFGVDHFIDYKTEDFAHQTTRYDVFFDMVAASSMKRCLAVLQAKGRYLTGNPSVLKMLGTLWVNLASRRQATFKFAGEKRHELQALADMLEQGDLKVILDSQLPLEKAAEAHLKVENETRLGPVVLVP